MFAKTLALLAQLALLQYSSGNLRAFQGCQRVPMALLKQCGSEEHASTSSAWPVGQLSIFSSWFNLQNNLRILSVLSMLQDFPEKSRVFKMIQGAQVRMLEEEWIGAQAYQHYASAVIEARKRRWPQKTQKDTKTRDLETNHGGHGEH